MNDTSISTYSCIFFFYLKYSTSKIKSGTETHKNRFKTDLEQSRAGLGGYDLVLEILVDKVDVDGVLEEGCGRECLTTFQTRLEGLEVGLYGLVCDVDGSAYQSQHPVRFLGALLVGYQQVQPTS